MQGINVQTFVSGIYGQVQKDWATITNSKDPVAKGFFSKIWNQSPSTAEADVLKKFAWARLGCAALMAGSLLGIAGGILTLNIPVVVWSVIKFALAHDLFQFLRNREELVASPLLAAGLKTLTESTLASDVIKNMTTTFNKEHPILRAGFVQLAGFNSKNTILKPIWDEIQLHMLKNGFNPFT